MTVNQKYWLWVEWRLGEGRFKGMGPCSKPRPAELPRFIPPTWWARLIAFLARRRKPAPDPLAFWRSTGVFEAWGLANGQFSPERLCEIAKARGCRWVAVQDSVGDRLRRDALKAACAERGLKLVVWMWGDSPQAAIETIRFWQPAAAIVNVEHRPPGGWDPFAAAVRGTFPRLPLAIISNLWGAGGVPTEISSTGYLVAEARVWWSRSFALITEAYLVNEQGPQPTLAPEQLDWAAKTHLEYPETFPCFGIFRTPPQSYSPYLLSWPHHSWYLAEYLPEAN